MTKLDKIKEIVKELRRSAEVPFTIPVGLSLKEKILAQNEHRIIMEQKAVDAIMELNNE